ncbi:hypothetical protein HMPREF1548_01915 [Clostridium sp. KLE 1755]|jgi:hypothetical protein|nr:hypothetical protein HMPREF1548_01915 [Clostridium sp. KLE 1755]
MVRNKETVQQADAFAVKELNSYKIRRKNIRRRNLAERNEET